MANEWSLNTCKGRGVVPKRSPTPSPVWDELFEALRAADPYGRQASIHNGPLLYNHRLGLGLGLRLGLDGLRRP